MMPSIRERFDRLPARPVGAAADVPAWQPARIQLADASHAPALMLVAPIRGSDDAADAAADLLDGWQWRLPGGALVRTAVAGEHRARVATFVIAATDAGHLPALEREARQALQTAQIEDFDARRDALRLRAVQQFDDPVTSARAYADLAIRHRQVTRFAEVRALAAMTSVEVLAHVDLEHLRVVTSADGPGAGLARVPAIRTSLHHLEVTRSSTIAAMPDRVDVAKPRVVQYQLANGMRVLLVPDARAQLVDARLVIAPPDGGRDPATAEWAAAELSGEMRASDSPEAVTRLRWYATVGQRVTGMATPRATIYRITGFGLFADWHVWKLAWTVLHGHYAEDHDAAPAASPHSWRPLAGTVLDERLSGVPAQGPRPSRRVLEVYRETYGPESSTLVVVGGFEVDAQRREIVTLFGGWRAAAAARTEPLATEPAVVAGPASIAVTMAHAPTVELAIAVARAPVAALGREAESIRVLDLDALRRDGGADLAPARRIAVARGATDASNAFLTGLGATPGTIEVR